jgi:hypothetical protein
MTAARRTQLTRLGVWIALATVAVLTAAISARTEAGVRRIATLFAPEAPARGAKAPAPLANRQLDQEAEQRRLSEAIRLLAADRDRLLARVNVLERNLDDVTGSIGPKGPAAVPPAALPPAALAPAPLPPVASAPLQTPASSPSRVTAGHLATGSPAAAESTATRTEFGIDLGGNASIEGLRTQWASLKAAQPAMLAGLRPLMAVREKSGSFELRLIAGPLANASAAARLCAALAAAGQACQPSVFDGQRLALQ